MLILTVAVNKEVIIDGPCRIVLLKDKRGNLKLGFKGPKSTKVLRGELIKGAA